jgi:peroxiredoxin 2/4
MTAVESPPITAMPRIADHAAQFTATTTQGPISFPRDYADKWVILFSRLADVTPVCTREFMTFASMQRAGRRTTSTT